MLRQSRNCSRRAVSASPTAPSGGTDFIARGTASVSTDSVPHGIMSIMKSIFTSARYTHLIPQVVLTSLFLLMGISSACSASKSAGSQSAQNNNSQAQLPAQTNATVQEKPTCQLTSVGAPDIKGLKPGMTPDEVLALFPGSKDDAEVRASLARPPSQFGVSSFLIKPDKYESPKEKFAGVSQITFTLLDGGVSSFSIGYNGPEYSHVDKFVAKFIEGTNLPAPDQWEAYVGMDNQLKILKCTDFEIRVFAGGEGGKLNYVLMKDLEAEKKLKERRDKARAQATPKP